MSIKCLLRDTFCIVFDELSIIGIFNCFKLDVKLEIWHRILINLKKILARVIGIVLCASHLNFVLDFALSVFL